MRPIFDPTPPVPPASPIGENLGHDTYAKHRRSRTRLPCLLLFGARSPRTVADGSGSTALPWIDDLMSLRNFSKREVGAVAETKHLLVALWVVAGPMTGCLASPPAPTLQVTLRLSPTPALVGPTRLIIEVTDVGGDPVAGAAVSVEGLPDQDTDREATTSDAVEEGTGRYVVPGFDLDVGGQWTLTVKVSESGGPSTTRAFPISVYGRS